MNVILGILVVFGILATLPIAIVLAAPPTNDDFVNRLVVDSSGTDVLPFNTSVNAAEATTHPAEPANPTTCDEETLSSVNPDASVWYEFTPDDSGRYQIDTAGSNYNTVLTVWISASGSLADMVLVACDDNTNRSTTSRMRERLLAGTTYYIRTSAIGTAGTTSTLNISVILTADAGGPYTIAEGESLTLNGSALAGDGSPITYAWDVNRDGVFTDASGQNPTLTWEQLVALGITDGPGSFVVQLEASTTNNNQKSAPVSVTVSDATDPVVTVPGAITEEATSPNGAAVTFDVSATDDVTASPLVTCSDGTTAVASGDTFAIGTTTVTCSATDDANNTSSDSFTITVQDTTPPTVTAPADIVQNATSPSGATAFYNVSVSDAVTQNLTATCVNQNNQPVASGNTFPIGVTTVTCSATDAANNTGSDTFTITILDGDAQFDALRAYFSTTGLTGYRLAGLIAHINFAEGYYDKGQVSVSCMSLKGLYDKLYLYSSVFAKPGLNSQQIATGRAMIANLAATIGCSTYQK